jgi:hypothetical protein
MSRQEYEPLRSLLTQLVEIQGVKKDPEADLLIREAVAQQPDAAYLLVRRTLLLGAALDEARRRIAVLRTQRDPPWGFGSPPEAIAADLELERRAYRTAAPPAPSHATPTVPSASAGSGASPVTIPRCLGKAPATAAGVASDAFLYQGIEDLFGDGCALPAHDMEPPDDDVTGNSHLVSLPEDQRTAESAFSEFLRWLTGWHRQ